MKNQYFGDVNDYRKYGLVRLIGGEGEIRLGVCWMLTPDDERPDGEKTEYLHENKTREYRHYDPRLYEFLKRKVHGHETEVASRNIRHFDETQLPNGQFYNEIVEDAVESRQRYFYGMWTLFGEHDIELIFFDPDDGLANNNNPTSPLRKGHKGSAKKLFRDEVQTTLDNGFSILLYQHFDHSSRSDLVQRLGAELAGMTNGAIAYSFWTPHVVFFLASHPDHTSKLRDAVERVQSSPWATDRSAKTSRVNGYRQITVTKHELLGQYS